MKKIFTMLMVICMIMSLTACSCEHEWQDATCLAPKTCKLCNATEGDTLEHDWVMPTCVTPKTCMLCGATEGEALGHDMTEADYQNPATCKNCGYTDNETKIADAVLHDLHITNAEMNVPYDYITTCFDNEDEKTVGKLTLSGYETFDSAENYEAVDGYEWHRVNVEIVFSDESATNVYLCVPRMGYNEICV